MSRLFLATVVLCAFVATSYAGPSMPGCGPPPNMKNPYECCEIPKMVDESVIDECAKKHGPKGDSPPNPPAAHGANGPPMVGCCFSECIFNASKAVTNGNIDVPALKNFLKGRLNGVNDWQPVLEKTLDECVAEAAQKTPPSPAPGATGDELCDPKYGFIVMCMKRKSFLNCPASVYKASPECDELKKFADKCPVHHM